jgi:hypothetical protein
MSSAEDRERERLARVARNRADAAPVLEALRFQGFAIEWIADLFNQKLDYRTAIPTLADWLPRVANPDVKEDIVRALSVKWARGTAAPKLLVAEFERADDATGAGLRWAIGNALEVLADDELADEMIKLATDRRYGRAREMVVLGLGKLKDPRVTDVLIGLLADEEVVGHAVKAVGKSRATTARSRIEPLLDHPNAWIRKEAQKALARIDKDTGS